VAVATRGKIWLIGGRSGSSLYNSPSVWTWDMNSGSWDEVAQMTTARSAFAAGLNGNLYVMGGMMPTAVNPTVGTYDFETNQWTTLGPMPRPCFDAAVAQVENRIFLFGGSGRVGFSVSNQVDVLEVPRAAAVKQP
jgi:kelch-like protein 28